MLDQKKHYMSWPVIALLDFVTIISFENIFYPFQNQGLSVVISWIFLLFTYVIPYALIATQLGLTFDNQDGGLASWIRRGTSKESRKTFSKIMNNKIITKVNIPKVKVDI